jgi:hypothetical protein
VHRRERYALCHIARHPGATLFHSSPASDTEEDTEEDIKS